MPQAYISIDREEFENVLDKVANFELVDVENTNELVYEINVPEESLVVRIYSTIEDGVSRERGDDAIRCVLWHTERDVPVGGQKKTLRIGPTDSNPHGWAGNLVPKIADLLANWREYYHGECTCGGVFQLRDGKHGEFLGCSEYPRCENTRQVGEEEQENACPECGSGEMIERDGKYGEFLGCTNFPSCRHTENL